MVELTTHILMIIGLTLLPFVEIQASVPYGLFVAGLNWPIVFLVAALTNILICPLAYFIVQHAIRIACIIPWVHRTYHTRIVKIQKQIHPYVIRWGMPGITLFMASPLPGNGVYSTTLAAHALGMEFKRYMLAIMIGVLVSTALLTTALLAGSGILSSIFGV